MKNVVYNILKGSFLVSDGAYKKWRLILFFSALAIMMIASSHSADRKVHHIAKLNEEVKSLRSFYVKTSCWFFYWWFNNDTPIIPFNFLKL